MKKIELFDFILLFQRALLFCVHYLDVQIPNPMVATVFLALGSHEKYREASTK